MSKDDSDKLSKTIDEMRRQQEAIFKIGDTFVYDTKRRYFTLTLTYLAVVATVFVTLNVNSDSSIFGSSKNDAIQKELSILKSDLKKSQADVQSLRKELLSDEDVSEKLINNRLDKIEQTQNDIAGTILQDPDTAITSRLLREKQTQSEKDIARLESANAELEDKLDTILLSVVVIPIVGLVLNAVVSKFYKPKKEKSEV